jgi:RNA polymerase sigma factor (sigma-70 family)
VLLTLVSVDRKRWERELLDAGLEDDDAVAQPLLHAGADSTLDPARLAQWTELQQRVADLPIEQREVFRLHYYLGQSQAEVAEVLGQTPKKISRLWLKALGALADYLPN